VQQKFDQNKKHLKSLFSILDTMEWMVEKTISRYCPFNSPVCFSLRKAGTDVVVLHMLERPGHNLPSVSPFVMKLETFLRYMNIRRHPSETFRDTLLTNFATPF
jgi:hypothetical protein